MKTSTKYPPLTPDDILTLRGQPVAKRNDSFRKPIEEWIYYHDNYQNNRHAFVQESYLFRDGRLVSWTEKYV